VTRSQRVKTSPFITTVLQATGLFVLSFLGVAFLPREGVSPQKQTAAHDMTPAQRVEAALSDPQAARSLTDDDLRKKLLSWGAESPRDCVLWCDAHFIDTLTPEIVAACANRLWEADRSQTGTVARRLVMAPHRKAFLDAFLTIMKREMDADPRAVFQAGSFLMDLNRYCSALRGEAFNRWFRRDMQEALRALSGVADADALLNSAIVSSGAAGALDVPALFEYAKRSGKPLADINSLVAMGLSRSSPEAALAMIGTDSDTYLNFQIRETAFQNLAKKDFSFVVGGLSKMKSGRERNDVIMSLSKQELPFSKEDTSAMADLLSSAQARGTFFVNRAYTGGDPLKWITENLQEPYDIAQTSTAVMKKEWVANPEALVKRVTALPDSPAKAFMLNRIAVSQRALSK
jgi:hypothetical protein